MAKKSRPENTLAAKIVVLWETLTIALRKFPEFVSPFAALTAGGKIKKDSEFRGSFDLSLSRFGVDIRPGRRRFFGSMRKN